MMNQTVKEDFGSIGIVDPDEAPYNILKDFVESRGYNLRTVDICSINYKLIKDGVEVLFKLVHYSVPTMVTEPFYKLTLLKKPA